jgi:polysaccharide pyruvyl transferase WcaK-like protein
MVDYSDEARGLIGIAKCYRPFRRSLGYFGWTGLQNLGDEALYEAVRSALSPVIVYNHPRFYGKGKVIQDYLEDHVYSAMLLGAGTLINSVDYLTELRRLQAKKIRMFVFGAGVLEPNFQKEVAHAPNCLEGWVSVLNECEYVSVRGPISKKILDDYGYQNAVISGDPAVYFAKEEIESKRGDKLIGINVGTTAKGRSLWGGSDEKVATFVTKLCRVLLEKKYRVRLFSVWEGDRQCIERIARELSGSVEVEYIHVSHEKYMNKLQDVDIFIGEKLHSVILALCTYTPSIMISYAPKCEDFMTSIGFMDYSIRTNQLGIEVVLNMIERIEKDVGGFQQKLFASMQSLKGDLCSSAAALKSALLTEK